jgi:hypothetical protein
MGSPSKGLAVGAYLERLCRIDKLDLGELHEEMETSVE